MSKPLRLETAIASIQIVLNMNFIDQVLAMGTTEQDYKLLVGSKPWTADDKYRIVRMLETIMSNMVAKLGLPAFRLPAEYCAACITMFVHPANFFAACSWIPKSTSTQELCEFQGRPGEEDTGLETVTPSKLFALCIALRSENRVDNLARRFMEKTGKELGYEKETAEKTS